MRRKSKNPSDQLAAALGQLPPDARQMVEGLLGSGDVESVSVESTTFDAASGPPPGFDLAALDGVIQSVSVSGGPGDVGGDLEVVFDRPSYGPGDRVEGTITTRTPVKAVHVDVELAYCDASSQYVEHTVYDTAEKVHAGTIEPGTSIRFSLQMPSDALPNWEPAHAAAAGIGTTGAMPDVGAMKFAGLGRLFWAVVVTARRRGVVPHTVERHPVPVVDDPARWVGPPPPDDLPPVGERVKGWDVDVEIPNRSPRRGESLAIDVSIGRPGTPRGATTAKLVCELHHDVLSTSGSNNSRTRTTRIAIAHEDVRLLDPGERTQRLTFEIPADAPFSANRAKATKVGAFTMTSGFRSRSSFGGVAFAVRWLLIVQEDRRGRDPRRDAVIWVRP